jgi:hypothetical protein
MSITREVVLAGALGATPIIALGLIVPIPEAVIGGIVALVVFLAFAVVAYWMDREEWRP